VAVGSGRRPSAAERERVASRLRAACGEDRLSIETFTGRLALAYAARSRAELEQLVDDLPRPRAAGRAALAATAWLSVSTARVAEAWREPRAQELVLPLRERTLLGRSRDCGAPLTSAVVSAHHALLVHARGRWTIEDLGSLNGTFVNGRRILDRAEVRAGDDLRLGDVRFRLVAPGDVPTAAEA
jgi:FHA domain-containing protein/uncharacterized protein DUF1707